MQPHRRMFTEIWCDLCVYVHRSVAQCTEVQQCGKQKGPIVEFIISCLAPCWFLLAFFDCEGVKPWLLLGVKENACKTTAWTTFC